LPQLQNFVKSEANVVVYGQNREPDGLIGLVNCLRKEPGGHKVKGFFMMDETPDFDPKLPFYGDQLRKNLAINIYKSGKWGTYGHLLLEELQEVECEHCFGDVSAKGDLSSMRWLQRPPIDESSPHLCQWSLFYLTILTSHFLAELLLRYHLQGYYTGLGPHQRGSYH
jgi:fatty acid synthase